MRSVFDYGETRLIFNARTEVAGVPGIQSGNVHFEEGVVAGGKFYPKGRGDGEAAKVTVEDKHGGDHFANFVDCLRGGAAAKQHADIKKVLRRRVVFTSATSATATARSRSSTRSSARSAATSSVPTR